MEVSSICRVRNRYVIDIGGERFVLTRSQMEERPMQVGDDVDPDELDEWLLRLQFRPAMDYAVSLLAMRPHAEGELREKLQRSGYRQNTVELVLYKLRKYGLLDDAAFAAQWAAARSSRMGSRRIAQELRRKGVSAPEIEAAMHSVDEEEQAETAISLAAKGLRRARPGEDSRKVDQRVLAMLARRGFSFEEARRALQRARAGQAEADEES